MTDTAASNAATEAFVRIAVRVRDAESGERVAAEAFAAGAVGLEEREGRDGVTLDLYAAAGRAAAIHDAVVRVGVVAIEDAERVEATDWSEAWKDGIAATVISSRLVVRPPFAAEGQVEGAVEIVIRPAQAFGTGGHASTALALRWIDAIAPGLSPGDWVLDVGTGSGVLALAAVALGPARAIGIDLDLIALREARENAELNGLGERIVLARASADAVGDDSLDLVVANLLRREVEPLLWDLARCMRAGAHAIFSGLLADDCDGLARELARRGLREIGRRTETDAGGDSWVALLTRR